MPIKFFKLTKSYFNGYEKPLIYRIALVLCGTHFAICK